MRVKGSVVVSLIDVALLGTVAITARPYDEGMLVDHAVLYARAALPPIVGNTPLLTVDKRSNNAESDRNVSVDVALAKGRLGENGVAVREVNRRITANPIIIQERSEEDNNRPEDEEVEECEDDNNAENDDTFETDGDGDDSEDCEEEEGQDNTANGGQGMPVGSTGTIPDISVGTREDNNASPTTVAASAGLQTPSNLAPQTFTVADGCTKFYIPESGDYCYKVIEGTGLTLEQFYCLNPALDADCQNLEIGLSYCVGFNGKWP